MADFEVLVPEVGVWILVPVQTHSVRFALFSCTACSPLGFVLGNGILWHRRVAEICPAHHDPSLQGSHSCRDPAQLSVCSGTADGVQPVHFPVECGDDSWC